MSIVVYSLEKARRDLASGMEILEQQLRSSKFIATNDYLTLADISLVSTLLYPFKLVCDEEFLSPYEHVVRWFEWCVTEPSFLKVLGTISILGKERGTLLNDNLSNKS